MSEQMGTTFSIDFSGVPDRVAAPAGEYILEVVGVEKKISGGEKTSGSEMLTFHWKIVESEHQSHMWENLILHVDSMWKVKQCFKALGLIDANGRFQGSTDELVGARVRARLTQEIWAIENQGDGELRNRVARYLPLAAAEEDAETLTDLFDNA